MHICVAGCSMAIVSVMCRKSHLQVQSRNARHTAYLRTKEAPADFYIAESLDSSKV